MRERRSALLWEAEKTPAREARLVMSAIRDRQASEMPDRKAALLTNRLMAGGKRPAREAKLVAAETHDDGCDMAGVRASRSPAGGPALGWRRFSGD